MAEIKTTITVFLGCSKELESDQRELGDFFSELNGLLADHGTYLRLVRWQWDGVNSPLKDYASLIHESELCLFLYFTTAGDTMEERFSEALKAFRAEGRPRIVTWFREVPDEKTMSSELSAFRDRLDGELHHFYNTYGSLDSVKLGMLLQIARDAVGDEGLGLSDSLLGSRGGASSAVSKSLEEAAQVAQAAQGSGMPAMGAMMPKAAGEKPAAVLEVKDDCACLWGVPLVSLSGVPAYEGWRGVQDAKEELAATERRYLELKARYLENPGDASVAGEYLSLAERRKGLTDEVAQGQRAFLDFMLTMSKRTTSDAELLTPRQREAYRLAEQGKIDAAIAMLDERELADERDLAIRDLETLRAAEEGARSRLRANVAEQLQLARLLQSKKETPELAERIERIFRKAVELERRYDLGWRAQLAYGSYLEGKERYEEAFEVMGAALAPLEAAEDPGSLEVVSGKSQALTCMSTCRLELGDRKGAIEYDLRRVDALRSGGKKLQLSLAIALRDTAAIMAVDGQLDRAREKLDEALGMLEVPLERESVPALRARYDVYLTYINIGNLAGDYGESSKWTKKCVATASELSSRKGVTSDDKVLLPDAYIRMGSVHMASGNMKEARRYLEDSLWLCGKSLKEDFDTWLPATAQTLCLLALLDAASESNSSEEPLASFVNIMRDRYAREPEKNAIRFAQMLSYYAIALFSQSGREQEALTIAREAAGVVRPFVNIDTSDEVAVMGYLGSLVVIVGASYLNDDDASASEAAQELIGFVRSCTKLSKTLKTALVAALSSVSYVENLPYDVRIACLDSSIEAMESLSAQGMTFLEEQLKETRYERKKLLDGRDSREAEMDELERMVANASKLYEKGRWEKARDVLEDLIERVSALGDFDDLMLALWEALAHCYYELGDIKNELECLRWARKIAAQAGVELDEFSVSELQRLEDRRS